jgi:5-methylthioadenosine/S-adenosylhomocysteine deaminase
MLSAHSIFLSPKEMEILAGHQIRAVHCPFSNSGKGVPKTPQMLSMGISCGFGSDGAGHGGLDLFREIRLFRCLINVTRGLESADSSVMPAETLLKMATQGGAAALFEEETVGVIAPGAKADLIALRTDSAALWPTQNLVHTVTESACGADVAHAIIDGRLVMKDRALLTLDEDRIRFEAEKAFEKEPFLINWK